jgi:hypothetical protein
MRAAIFTVSVLVLVTSGAVHRVAAAQDAGARPETSEPVTEEIIVTGRQIARLRFEAQAARERVYEIFNDINSDDEFDIFCTDQTRAGTRVPQRVCRAQFESRISSTSAGEYMAGLTSACGVVTQECIFSEVSQQATSRAQGVEAEAPYKRALLDAEIQRLARENPDLRDAILGFLQLEHDYNKARKGRED